MIWETTATAALAYITTKHQHQYRKRNRNGIRLPYITHCIDVCKTLWHCNAITPETGIAALLHDVLEDTDATYDDLVVNFGTQIADIVQQLTHVPAVQS